MKVLFLNPQIDAAHSIVKGLQARGAAVLVPANADEAWQLLQLHGTSIDLAIVHREGAGQADAEAGIKFMAKVRADASQADLPWILTSGVWADAEFAKHQKGPNGANAYLAYPFREGQLVSLIEGVLGESVGASATGVIPTIPNLEAASKLFKVPEIETGSSSIQLESPDPALSSPSIPTAVPTSAIEIESSIPAVAIELSSVGPVADEASVGAFEPVDSQAVEEMPYLFGAQPAATQSAPQPMSPLVFQQPVGDSIVPGGAAQSPDTETLKKYLLLREQDVAVLSTQLRSAQDRIASLETSARDGRSKNIESEHVVQEQKEKIAEFEREKALALEGLQTEINELKFQNKTRADKARIMESQIREATDEMERLKDRVRSDIRKIRVREKELENRLEIVKKDSEALIAARENKIVELKRKLDLLEFNMDLLQDQYVREKDNSARLRVRLSKAAQVVRVAGGLLGTSETAAATADTSGVLESMDSERDAS